MNKPQAAKINAIMRDAEEFPQHLRVACYLKEIFGIDAAEFNKACQARHFPLISDPMKLNVENSLRELRDREQGNGDMWYDRLWQLSCGGVFYRE